MLSNGKGSGTVTTVAVVALALASKTFYKKQVWPCFFWVGFQKILLATLLAISLLCVIVLAMSLSNEHKHTKRIIIGNNIFINKVFICIIIKV